MPIYIKLVSRNKVQILAKEWLWIMKKKFLPLHLYNSLLTVSKSFFSFIYASKIILFLFWFANVSANFFGKSPCAENIYGWEKLFAKLSWIHWMLLKHEPNNKSSAWKKFWGTNFWSSQVFGNCNEAVGWTEKTTGEGALSIWVCMVVVFPDQSVFRNPPPAGKMIM